MPPLVKTPASPAGKPTRARSHSIFQEVLDRTINRRLVTQTLFVKFKGDTLTQLVNAFPLIHLRLLQPLHNGLAGLLDNLLIGFNALR